MDEGLWIPNDVRLMWIVVYAPQNLSNKIALWYSLVNLIGERFGSVFNERQSDIFNEFITTSSLIDIPLGGFKFTWTDKWGSKMSKLDRFLVFERFYEVFPHATCVVLEKGILDHCLILFKDFVVDHGPTPFCFFDSWLEMDGFHDLVVQIWNHDGIIDASGFISIKKKL
ncbi:RNA-directed DNA polymerase, eukaryota, reverse transcriptase zinc-binding domain protein [Tanacetum coccineum]|uniref:RNA-directed DNA polymerase, eukaryota, reverse transcriptase zinc-binding domain protein n=1 Tax=Tanacetum coccineum TaxID=301880 RepID=A0ABQ5A9A3_9ASTR